MNSSSSNFYSGSTCESESFFDWTYLSTEGFNQESEISDFKAKQICSPFGENFSFEEFHAEDLDCTAQNFPVEAVLEESKKIQKKPAKTQIVPKSAKKSDSNRKRNPWTASEDEKLLHFMGIYGGNQWAKIATHIPNRTGKQVRDRYLSALVSNINRNPWTEEEDRKILNMLEEMGPQWCRIAEALENRTDIQVKNRYNTYLKKNGINYSEASPKEIYAAELIFSQDEEPNFADIDYEQLGLNINCF